MLTHVKTKDICAPRAATVGAPVPEVPRELGDLQHEVELLSEIVQALGTQLRPITCAAPTPECAVAPLERVACYSGLGAQLRETADRLRAEIAKLRLAQEALAI